MHSLGGYESQQWLNWVLLAQSLSRSCRQVGSGSHSSQDFTGVKEFASKLILVKVGRSQDWCFQTVVLKKTLESPLDCKEVKPANPKGDHFLIFIGRTDAEVEAPVLWPLELAHWKRLWCWERLKEGGEGDYRGWDGWMASLTQWTWVWVSSRR